MEEFNLNAAYLWGGSIVIVTIIMAWVVTRPTIVFLRASFGSSQEALDSLELALFKARKGVEKRKNWIESMKARRNERWAEGLVKAWGESQAVVQSEVTAPVVAPSSLSEEIALLKEQVAVLMALLEKAEDLNSRNAVRSVDLVRAEQARHREDENGVERECAEIWAGGSCPDPSACKHYF